MCFLFRKSKTKKVISEQRKVREEDRIKSVCVREREKRWKRRQRERKQELFLSREKRWKRRLRERKKLPSSARRSSSFSHANERVPIAPLEKPCEKLASSAPPSGVRLLFNPPELRDFGAVRFGNITDLIHCTLSYNHLEKERDACSVPTQPLAATMPVETDNDVAAAFCAARSRAPCVYFQRKGRKPHFLRRFPSLLTSKGSMRFRRNERRQKCLSAPSNATVGADGDVAIVFFFLSVFSQAYLCPRRSTNQDGAEEERSCCPCPRGGHDGKEMRGGREWNGRSFLFLFSTKRKKLHAWTEVPVCSLFSNSLSSPVASFC
jgi:hypothetical protein